MNVSWLLPATALVPLAGALLLLLLPRVEDVLAARLGALIGGVTLLLAAWASFVTWNRGFGRMQLEVRTDWVPALGLKAHLGMDGISAPLVLLTALLAVLVCVHLIRVQPEHGQVRLLVVCVLAVTGGAVATFTALDLLLFFVAFETVLIPMCS